jgi:hypothetical protein
MRAQVPARWLLKDLAALYFSVMEIGLSQRDLLRFLYVTVVAILSAGFKQTARCGKACSAKPTSCISASNATGMQSDGIG